MPSNNRITVTQEVGNAPFRFQVQVQGNGSESRHSVTMASTTYQQLTGGRVEPAVCIHAAFTFFLDREPKEAILSRFDVTVISRYFPEFSKKLPGYF